MFLKVAVPPQNKVVKCLLLLNLSAGHALITAEASLALIILSNATSSWPDLIGYISLLNRKCNCCCCLRGMQTSRVCMSVF